MPAGVRLAMLSAGTKLKAKKERAHKMKKKKKEMKRTKNYKEHGYIQQLNVLYRNWWHRQ